MERRYAKAALQPSRHVQRQPPILDRDERKCFEHVVEFVGAQLVQLRDDRVEACEGRRVEAPLERAGEERDLVDRRRRILLRRQRQLLDYRGGDVRRDPEAHEIVHDEAVEQAAEEMLRRRRERRPQAEHRVRRDDAAGQDGKTAQP